MHSATTSTRTALLAALLVSVFNTQITQGQGQDQNGRPYPAQYQIPAPYNGAGQYTSAGQGYGQGQPYPAAGYANQAAGGSPQAPANVPKAMSVAQWFSAYDQIRHQAQMSPIEKQNADSLLSRGMSILMPGPDKEATKRLLAVMVGRYQRACDQFRQLPQLQQTAYLHRAYFDYFATANQLFGDYLKVQDNLMATDAATGQPLASSLLLRKQNLEILEHKSKDLDGQTRQQLGIAPYPW